MAADLTAYSGKVKPLFLQFFHPNLVIQRRKNQVQLKQFKNNEKMFQRCILQEN